MLLILVISWVIKWKSSDRDYGIKLRRKIKFELSDDHNDIIWLLVKENLSIESCAHFMHLIQYSPGISNIWEAFAKTLTWSLIELSLEPLLVGLWTNNKVIIRVSFTIILFRSIIANFPIFFINNKFVLEFL